MSAIESRLLAQGQERLATLALAAGEFAEHQAHEAADLTNHARFGDRGADLRDAAHHGLRAKDRQQPFGGVNAVLERDYRRVGSHQRLDRLTGGLHVPQLDAEQHEIHRPDAGRIVGRLAGGNHGFTAAAFDPQAVFPHGFQVGAAGDECDVGTGIRQGGPEGTADTAGSDNGYTHGSNSLSLEGIRS